MASAPSTPPSSYKDLYLELRSQYEEVMKFRFESSQQLTEHENVVDELQEEINNMLDLMMELNPSLKINQIHDIDIDIDTHNDQTLSSSSGSDHLNVNESQGKQTNAFVRSDANTNGDMQSEGEIELPNYVQKLAQRNRERLKRSWEEMIALEKAAEGGGFPF